MGFWPFFGRTPKVAVLRLSGVISASDRSFSGGLSAASLNISIQRAFSMRGVKAVALLINSPGGSPVQSALICRRIRTLALEKELPVFAFIEDVAASGGYWLACAADEIYADANSIVGSIGVISSGFGFQDAIQRLGVERRVYSQGKHKAILDPFKAEDPEGVEMLMDIQKEIYEGFKLHVQERRGKRLAEESEHLFGGDVWTGKRALDLGLIDGLGDLYSVTRERFGEEVKIRFVDVPKKWFRRRLGLAAGLETNGSFQDNFVEKLWHQLETRALWSKYGL
tara:strand:- start:8 stop:853 length:846 start_codon:yes stop_codon:yes gene_type:complete